MTVDESTNEAEPVPTTEDTEMQADAGEEEGDEAVPKSAKVYVGNLEWSVTSEDLEKHMTSTGCSVVSAEVMRSGGGRSKGCGLVMFETPDDASNAILTLNDSDLMGRSIFVREDREEASSGRKVQKKGSGEDASAAPVSGTRLYVGNLAYNVRWQTLKDFFRQAGNVLYAEVMTEGGSGRSKGCGIVEMETVEEAEAAKLLTDQELNGRPLFVREDRENGKSSSSNGSASVYVGNLSYETSWQDLKDHMRAAGNVDKADIITGSDGRSKGCGVVTYQKAQDATRAINELQDSILNERPIFVREDREHGKKNSGRSNRGGGYRGGGGGVFSGGAESGCQLFVSNLSFDTTWRELKDHFRQAGDVEHVDVLEYPNGRKKGTAIVRFSNEEDAANATETLNGVELMGRDLGVKIDQNA